MGMIEVKIAELIGLWVVLSFVFGCIVGYIIAQK